MTTNSESSRPRFRTGQVAAPASVEERLALLLDDGERLYELYEQAATDAARAGDSDLVVRLARVATGATDPQRAYAAQRLAASLLVALATTRPHDDTDAWIAPLDATVGLLVPVLDANPHEPELLLLLGTALYELGHTALARRLFEAVRALEPEHAVARANLRACKERMAGGGQRVAPVADERTPHAGAPVRTHVKSIAERATRLVDRPISLCMIVKDEEEMLPGCLAAVAEHVDELVIVDTGSTDRTREIAAEYGAKVVEFAWNGSFSDARNEGLRHATGDWILWLDADEHLVDGDGPQLRRLARKSWVEGFHIVETHFMGTDDIGNEAMHAPMRMFRRRPEHVWRGTVHEQVLWALPTWLGERLQQTTVRVNHYGYMASVIDDRGKRERNLELLLTQAAAGRTAFVCFNVGTEYAAMQDWPQARQWFEEALVLSRDEHAWQDQQFAPLMVQRAAAARRSTGDAVGAIELLEQGLQAWPAYTDLVYERALVHAGLEQWEQVRAHAQAALDLGDAPARFVAVAGKGSFQALSLLAQAQRELGDADGARTSLERAVREAPHHLETTIELADLLLRQHEAPEEVSRTIDATIGAERAAAASTNLLLGSVFHEAGAYDVADERYGRVLAARPGHGAALVARAELRLAQHRYRDAWDDAMRLDPLDAMSGRGGRTAFLAAVVLEDTDLLAAPAERIAADERLPVAERAVYVAWRQRIDAGSSRIATLVPQDATAATVVLRNLEALAKLEAPEAFEQLYPLVAQTIPDERTRRMALAELYLRRRFADMAGEELLACAQQFGPDAQILMGLGKVATMKEMWADAEVFLAESLAMDPQQDEVERLLAAVRERVAG